MKVGIIGYGYVGEAMERFFNKKYETWVFDGPKGLGLEADVNGCDLAIVCVPTPMAEDKSCDTSIVEQVVEWCDAPLILIKSTVAPGTTDRLKEKYGKRIVFSPEYCGEPDYDPGHNFATNAANEPFHIFGGAPEDTAAVVQAVSRIAGPTKTYMQVSAVEAEIIKYMENSFLGLKVVFTYEMQRICEAIGADFYKVREGWLLDPRVNKSHTMYFEDNETPFGGKCLPKDLNGIVRECEKRGYSPDLIKEALKSNERLSKCG